MDTTLTFTPTFNSCVVLHTLMQRSFGMWSGAHVLCISSSLFSSLFFKVAFFSLIPNIFYFSLPERRTMPPATASSESVRVEIIHLDAQGTATHRVPRQVLCVSRYYRYQHQLPLVPYKIITSTQEYGTKLKATEGTLELTNTKYTQTQKDPRPSSRDPSLFKNHARKRSILD